MNGDKWGPRLSFSGDVDSCCARWVHVLGRSQGIDCLATQDWKLVVRLWRSLPVIGPSRSICLSIESATKARGEAAAVHQQHIDHDTKIVQITMGCAASSNVHPDPNQSSKPKHTPGSVVHGKRGQALLRAGGSLDPEKLQLSDPKDSAADLPKLEVNSQSTAVQASGRTEPAQSFRWRKGRLLGRGTFGSVFLCLVENTGGFMAVKEVPFSHDNIKEIQVIAEEISMVRYELSTLKQRRADQDSRKWPVASIFDGKLILTSIL